jgi:hypothetical protein
MAEEITKISKTKTLQRDIKNLWMIQSWMSKKRLCGE